ncbi:MAG: hypothetical protein ACLULL_06180 [Parabacteroides distasonis]
MNTSEATGKREHACPGKRGYTSPEWNRLAAKVTENGMRNAYLLAIAPTSSTSIIASTAGC